MIHGPAYVGLMLKYAILISGYTMPDLPPPKLVEITHQQMIHEACNDHRPCEVYGTYRDDEIIKVDTLLIHHDHISFNSVVVHELTHWLQHHHGKAGFTCKMIGIREREAYGVQNEYMHEYEHNLAFLKPPDWDC
jgi:hypothetical protein